MKLLCIYNAGLEIYLPHVFNQLASTSQQQWLHHIAQGYKKGSNKNMQNMLAYLISFAKDYGNIECWLGQHPFFFPGSEGCNLEASNMVTISRLSLG